MKRALLTFASVACLLAVSLGAAAADHSEPIPVRVKPIDTFHVSKDQSEFGDLTFLGGLDLVSPNRRFGGFSGIEVSEDGSSIWLLGDKGDLITAQLKLENGRLTGLDDVAIQAVRPATGGGPGSRDFEDLTRLSDDMFLLAREARGTPLLRHKPASGETAHAIKGLNFAGLKQVPRNKGVESIAVLPGTAFNEAGGPPAVLAIAERPPSGSDWIDAWLVDLSSGGGQPKPLRVRARDGFDVTSARFLPDGDLLLLERRTGALLNSAARLRRISDDIAPGAELDGEVLLEASLSHEIDNMEGLAIHQDENGRTILTLVSDDNFSIIQRTLILRFALNS